MPRRPSGIIPGPVKSCAALDDLRNAFRQRKRKREREKERERERERALSSMIPHQVLYAI
jgi:hypothetical protein